MHRLTLPDNHWVDVKEEDEITVKDEREMWDFAGVRSVNGEASTDLIKYAIARAVTRIVNWSLTRADGTPLRWQAGQPFRSRLGTLDLLTKKQFEVVSSAVSAYYREADDAEDDSKNAPPTDSGTAS